MPKLSEEQVKQKLQEGRNYKRLYFELKDKFDDLKQENKQLKQELVDQREYFESIVETQAAQIAELQTMVFGRKPKGGSQDKVKTGVAKQSRPNDSYRRPLPPASAITHYEHHGISNCHRCGHELTDKTEAIRYEEDIELAALESRLDSKKVTMHTIETGWCSKCGQYSSAKDLRGQVVTIGENVRSLIVYLVIQADLTYSQTVDLLGQLYSFRINSGEIAHILATRRQAYLPAYEKLKTSVRAGPAHMDETSCPIQSEQGNGYAHVMVSAMSEDVVFKLADSRGKGNSQKLVGKSYQGVGITDRYGAYKHLFELHQICWAHLHRNARDITYLECLGKRKLAHVTKFYDGLSAIYAAIRQYKEEPFDAIKRQEQAAELLEQTKALCTPHKLDPKKLIDLKAGILEYQDCLFLCLIIPGIPADNNKAERALRKLVIKRKKSFGVKTMKGARTMEVLLSVCQSLYNRDKDSFLPALHKLATVSQ
jgi:transposase